MANGNKWHIIFAGLMIGLISLTACSGVPGTSGIDAELDTPFQLKIGQSAQIVSEGLTIDFLEVTEDSRCPGDVECIVAGKVSTLISITENDAVRGDYNLTFGNGEDSSAVTTPDGFTVQLKAVAPYPNTSQPIDRADYKAIFLVSEN